MLAIPKVTSTIGFFNERFKGDKKWNLELLSMELMLLASSKTEKNTV
jgi:hypothetical protein